VYPWGSGYSGEHANGVTESGNQRDQWEETAPAKSFAPNRFGLYDMVGNVWEWTSSLYNPYPYRPDDGREDPSSKEARAVRGDRSSTTHACCGCRIAGTTHRSPATPRSGFAALATHRGDRVN
jgi:formylglycine-generating enzyme required for sulfatase activity